MELYFLRHGVAVDHGMPGYPKDSERPLTEEGIKKMKKVAQGMKALELDFDSVLSSPYLRAKETAEIAVEILKLKKKLKFTQNLIPSASFKNLVHELKEEHAEEDRILLVGHEPNMSMVISHFLAGNGLAIEMKKAGLCKLTVGHLDLKATLNWLLTPSQLSRLN